MSSSLIPDVITCYCLAYAYTPSTFGSVSSPNYCFFWYLFLLATVQCMSQNHKCSVFGSKSQVFNVWVKITSVQCLGQNHKCSVFGSKSQVFNVWVKITSVQCRVKITSVQCLGQNHKCSMFGSKSHFAIEIIYKTI